MLNWYGVKVEKSPNVSPLFRSPPVMVSWQDSSTSKIVPFGYIRPQFIKALVAICLVPSAGRLIVDTFCMMSPSFVLLLFPVHKCA